MVRIWAGYISAGRVTRTPPSRLLATMNTSRACRPSLITPLSALLTLVVTVTMAGTAAAGDSITTADALVAAVRDGGEGATITIGPGTFALEAPLEPKTGMTITGAGMEKTIITGVAGWQPSTGTLPDPEMKTKGMDTNAYLIRLKDKADRITISGLTLRGPQLHGAVFGWEPTNLHL